MLLLPSEDTGSQHTASQSPWDQHLVSCPCRKLCSSSRAELSLPSPSWTEEAGPSGRDADRGGSPSQQEG